MSERVMFGMLQRTFSEYGGAPCVPGLCTSGAGKRALGDPLTHIHSCVAHHRTSIQCIVPRFTSVSRCYDACDICITPS